MKKVFLTVAAALVMTFALQSCGESKADQMLTEYENLIEEAEQVKSNPLKIISLISDWNKIQEKYKDVNTDDFTPEQKERYDQLFEKGKSLLGL